MIFDWMPLIFTFMLAGFPAGLVIYWAWNNTLSVLQQSFIMRRNGVKVELFDNLQGDVRLEEGREGRIEGRDAFLVIARSEAEQSILPFRDEMDCFAESVIGRRFAPTRRLAMTVEAPCAPLPPEWKTFA